MLPIICLSSPQPIPHLLNAKISTKCPEKSNLIKQIHTPSCYCFFWLLTCFSLYNRNSKLLYSPRSSLPRSRGSPGRERGPPTEAVLVLCSLIVSQVCGRQGLPTHTHTPTHTHVQSSLGANNFSCSGIGNSPCSLF